MRPPLAWGGARGAEKVGLKRREPQESVAVSVGGW